VTEFSRTLIERSGYDDEAFAELYDRHRPSPPAALLDILALVAQTEQPRLVVDLGAGTGLSTLAWAERADEVVGVEPNPSMIRRARLVTRAPNVRYVEAFAGDTGLRESSADLVTCAQSFHWMEPAPVLAEAARVLRPGGVFAAYDYDVRPIVQPEVDEAFAAHLAARRRARARLGLAAGVETWPKEEHLDRIRESGRFRFAREIVCHGMETVDADRVVGLAQTLGGPHALFHEDAGEVMETFERVRAVARRVLGDGTRTMVVCYWIRLGIK
jgi:ubiquinone/menaquinone biosynthesis C-methylase UbiE